MNNQKLMARPGPSQDRRTDRAAGDASAPLPQLEDLKLSAEIIAALNKPFGYGTGDQNTFVAESPQPPTPPVTEGNCQTPGCKTNLCRNFF